MSIDIGDLIAAASLVNLPTLRPGGSSGAPSLTAAGVDRIPVAEAWSPASKGFPMIFKKTRKILSVATPTFSATPTVPAVELYFDMNRGRAANAGAGTRADPKNDPQAYLTSLAVGAGSVLAFAEDSVFEYVSLINSVKQINCDNITSAGAQILFTSYAAAGHTGLKPTFQLTHNPSAGEWTWDGTANAWYYSPSNAVYPNACASAFFGTLMLDGINVWQKSATSRPAMTGDFQYGWWTDYSTFKRFYVYAPPGTNPTDYYGIVRLNFGFRGIFFTGFNGLKNCTFDGLQFGRGDCGIAVNPGNTVHTGLIVKNCSADRVALLDHFCSLALANSFTATNNVGTNQPAAFIKMSGSGSATLTADINTNSVTNCNVQYSAMGAFYSNAKAVTLGDIKVHKNYVYGARNGVGSSIGSGYGCPFDGSAVYFDLGSGNNVAFGNIVEYSHVAFQTNSAKTAQVLSNLAINCPVLVSSTDAGNVGSNDVTIAHNTYINNLSNTDVLPSSGTATSNKIAIVNWFENHTSSAIRVFNNALYRATPITDSEAIRTANEPTTKFVSGNAISGWTQAVKALSRNIDAVGTTPDGSTIIDITATALNITSGGAAWFEGGTCAPVAGSALTYAGVRYIDGMMDITGTSFGRIPSIGCQEYTPS